MTDPVVSVHSYVVSPETAKCLGIKSEKNLFIYLPEVTKKKNTDEVRKDPIMDNSWTWTQSIVFIVNALYTLYYNEEGKQLFEK